MAIDYSGIHTFAICTYKESPYLEECICSLKNQTVKSRIVISTSTPTDGVLKLSKKHNIDMYIHNQGGSIGKDWNAAWEYVTTKYITIIHQDDVYMPRFLETNIKNLERDAASVLAFTNYCEIDSNSALIPRNRNLLIKDIMLKVLQTGKNSRFIRDRVMSMGSPICCPAVTYNRNLLIGFKFSGEVSATVDWDAFYRINRIKGKWYYTNENLMYHRIHNGSETSAAIENNERTQEELKMFRRYWPKLVAEKLNNCYSRAQLTNNQE